MLRHLVPVFALATVAGCEDKPAGLDAGVVRCLGVDCSGFDTACTQSTCDETTGECVAHDLADDTACDDGAPCTTGDSCQTGMCIGDGPTLPQGFTFAAGTATATAGTTANGLSLDEDDCPSGQALVGVDVDVATFVDAVTFVCGTPKVQGSGLAPTFAVASGATLPRRGAPSGTTTALRCPAGTVVVGFSGRAGSVIDAIALRCAPIAPACNAAGDFTFSVGTIAATAEAGDAAGGSAFGPDDCTDVATGAHVESGDNINVLGLRCGTLPVPP